MFSVILEVRPRVDEWHGYLGDAEMLQPELEQVDGFIDNTHYKGLTREGWILSLSGWRDEKSLVRWRTRMDYHEVLERGRNQLLADYHLRVGQLTQDTELPKDCQLIEQRFDETEVGEGKAITLITATRPERWAETTNPDDCAEFLGLNPYADGLLAYDVFEAVGSPGQLLLLCSWRDNAAAEAFETSIPGPIPPGGRLRRIRIIRDYGMFDRREAPQFFADASRSTP
jgi:heme-degrading monooxygenase HmoA